MFQRIVNTGNDLSGPVLRVILAVIFFVHGTQKAFGWFGGKGFGPSLAFLANVYHIPSPLAILLIVVEIGGAICLVLGFMGRIAALGTGFAMLVATIKVYQLFGHFMMNWGGSGTYKGEGIEYHLLAMAASLAIIAHGSGAFSIDRLLAREEGARENLALRHAAVAGIR